MTVIIAGGGIGGLSLALALARRGLESTVIEAAPAIEAVGAGLQLGPNATSVLAGWGLADALAERAVEPVQAVVRDARTGAVLVRSRFGQDARARWGAPYLGLTRAALQSLLLEAAQASGLVRLRLGARIASVRSEALAAVAVLEGGVELEGEVLFGCDGLRSQVQAAVFGRRAPRYTGQTVWRGLAALPTDAPAEVQVWTAPRRHFVRYPVSRGLVNMVAVVEAPAAALESWTEVGQGGELAAAFAGWPESVRAAIAAVERPWRSALYDRAPLARWSHGRISLLGDAAHPMLPFLAQGAAMAIEDAEVAASLLAGGGDRAAALRAYEGARLSRTAKVQAWSRRNAVLFHLPSPVATGVFGAAKRLDQVRGVEGEARFDWLYGWTP